MANDVVDRFAAKYSALAGIVHRVPGHGEAARIVAEVVRQRGGGPVALGDLPPGLMSEVERACAALGAEVLKPPFDDRSLPGCIDAARVGVSWAAFAVADAGAMVEFATDDAVRLVSTLPRTHVGILRAGDIKPGLADAAEPIRAFYARTPAGGCATFISGPSRTGDIEMRLTLGVHGPEASHAVIVEA